jgi:hypothetical protein
MLDATWHWHMAYGIWHLSYDVGAVAFTQVVERISIYSYFYYEEREREREAKRSPKCLLHLEPSAMEIRLKLLDVDYGMSHVIEDNRSMLLKYFDAICHMCVVRRTTVRSMLGLPTNPMANDPTFSTKIFPFVPTLYLFVRSSMPSRKS